MIDLDFSTGFSLHLSFVQQIGIQADRVRIIKSVLSCYTLKRYNAGCLHLGSSMHHFMHRKDYLTFIITCQGNLTFLLDTARREVADL